MSTASSYPPHVHLTPLKPTTPADALALIQNYLAASATQPHLHPDCHFVENGIQLNNPIETGGLILHQLRRVEAGLRGERLGADILLQEENALPDGDDGRLDAIINGNGATQEDTSMLDVDVEVSGDPNLNYQQQMSAEHMGDEQGDIGDRHTAVRDGGHIPAVRDASKKRQWEGEDDKEARKKAKKDRKKAEQRAREMAKERGAVEEKKYSDAVVSAVGLNGGHDVEMARQAEAAEAAVNAAPIPAEVAPKKQKSQKRRSLTETTSVKAEEVSLQAAPRSSSPETKRKSKVKTEPQGAQGADSKAQRKNKKKTKSEFEA